MFSSALYIAQKTQSRLVVIDPPYYLVAIVFLTLAGILLLATVLAGSQRDVPRGVIWIGVLFALPSLFAGSWVISDKAELILDRDAQVMTVRQHKLFLFGSNDQIPFSAIDRAEVEAGRGTRRLVVLMRSGGAIAIGSHTTQAGQYEMAKTINDFLAGR